MCYKIKYNIIIILKFILVLCIISVLISFGSKILFLRAAQDSPNMIVSYGIENSARYGRTMMVYVELNGTAADINGEIIVTLAKSGNNNMRYSKKVMIPAEESIYISILTDLNINYTDMLVVFESEKQETRVEQTILLNVDNYQYYRLCGILTKNVLKKSFYGDFGNKHYYLNENNLPDDYLGLDMLDLILIEDFDTSKLSDEQIKAISEWVMNGGTLILAPGIRFNEFSNNGRIITERELTFDLKDDLERLRELKDKIELYENQRTNIMINNEKIIKEASASHPYYLYVGDEMISSSKIDNANIKPLYKKIYEIEDSSAKVIQASEEDTILSCKNIGEGKVIYSSINLLRNNNKETMESTVTEAYLCSVLFDNISNKNKKRMDSEYSGFLTDNYWAVSILSYPDEYSAVSYKKLGIIILLYLILAVPVTFILLRKLKHTIYIWGLIPLLSLMFTIIIYLSTTNTRVKEPYFGYVDIKHIDNKNKNIYGNLDFYVGLYNNLSYSFYMENTKKVKLSHEWIEGYMNMLYNNGRITYTLPIDFNSYISSITYGDKSMGVTIDNTAAFQNIFYNAAYEADYEKIADGEIYLSEDTVEGTLVNHSAYTIKNVSIIADTLYIPLGDISSNSTVEFTEQYSLGLVSKELSPYIGRWDLDEYWNLSSDELRIRTAIQMALNQTIGKGEYYLIGITDEVADTNPLKDVCDSDKSFGTSVIIASLDAAESYNNESFISNIDIYKNDVLEGTEYADSRYITSEKLVINYKFSENEKITKLIFSGMLNNIPEAYYSMASEVYLLNIFTNEYDYIFDCNRIEGTQILDEERLINYIDEENTLTIKFNNTGMQSICMMPIISCYALYSQ